jgi:hypothetical protein
MNYNLVLVSLVLLALLVVLFLNRIQENFESNEEGSVNVQPDLAMRQYLSSIVPDNKNNTILEEPQSDLDMDNYVKKTNIELAARSVARSYCPVPPDYDATQYIKKTEIPEVATCPKMPDLKNYVLKSTVPAPTVCPSCVCPKVKVSAGLCKKCPKPEDICPKPKACGVEQCKNVIKCPEPAPCPTQEALVCPPVQIKRERLECPAPKPCPSPAPCPRVERCEDKKCPKCRFYGVRTLPQKSLLELLNDLLKGDEPGKERQIKEIRELLGMKYENRQRQPRNIPQPTSASDLRDNNERLVENAPVIDYNNKCEDNSMMYSAMGELGARF